MSNAIDQQQIRLACQACQRKKIKCDRTFPCGQCTRSSLQCVSSQRKPRARHTGKRAVDSELRNRIAKLEGLVTSLSSEVAGIDTSPKDGREHSPQAPDAATSPAVGKYIGTQFWSSFTTEVQALRDALEEDQGDEVTEPTTTTTSSEDTSDTTAHEYDLLICPPGMVFDMPGALAEPSPFVTAALYGAFIENVAPILSIFHVPSLQRFLTLDVPYFGLDASSPPCRAFKAAVWFAAVNTLSELDCQSRFGQKKPDMLKHYRRCVEVRLSQADLFTTTEMTTMHAFLTYLIAARTSDTSRRAWTLTATVVRIATAMDLHLEVPGKSPFEMEMRRRLWHQVRLADIFACGDRGTHALITNDTSKTLYPKNVDDTEFDETSTTIPDHETGLTDMSFAMIVYEATRTTHQLNFPDLGANTDTWPQRVQVAEAFKTRIEAKVLQYCDLQVPFHRMLYASGKATISGMLLRAVRPIQQHQQSPPRVDNPYVLQIAVDCLRLNEKFREDPETEKWRWIVWVQWQPLSVALASLCTIRGTALAEVAWLYVERAYRHWAKSVADASDGMLWKPVEKLYRKACAFRDDGRRESGDNTVFGPSSGVLVNGAPPCFTTTTTTAPAAAAAASSYVPTPAPFRKNPRPLGSIPLDPIMSSTMDFSGINGDMADDNIQAAADSSDNIQADPSVVQTTYTDEMDWLDWENVMHDFSEQTYPTTEREFTLGDLLPPGFVPPGGDWSCPLHADLV